MIQKLIIQKPLISRNLVRATMVATMFLTAASAHAATIVQTTDAAANVYWNTGSLWGGSAPTSGNNYVGGSGFVASGNILGGATFTGTLRADGTTFAGNSLQLVSGSKLLIKQGDGSTSSANIILDGGIVQYGANGTAAASAKLGGTLQVASNSVLGVSVAPTGASSTFTITSTVTGSSTLRIAADGPNTNKITFDGDLSGFSGEFQVGGGNNAFTLNFAQNYILSNMTLAYGDFASLDRLNLTNNLTVGAFTFGANTLQAGTYTSTQLNSLYGNGSQFTGSGLLTVVPESSTVALSGLGMLALLRRKRRL